MLFSLLCGRILKTVSKKLMATTLIILQLLIVFGFIFIGARVGGIGMGIYGMVGTFLLVTRWRN